MPNDLAKRESKELVESGMLIVKLQNIENKISRLESNPQETPVSSSEDDIYVIVSEKGAGIQENEGQLVHEQDVHSSSLKSIKERVEYLERKSWVYGKLRIARLVFLDEKK